MHEPPGLPQDEASGSQADASGDRPSRVAKTKLSRIRFFSRGLVNAAHSHQFDHIKEELLTDPSYVDLLDRCFTGASALAANAIVVTNGLQKNIEARAIDPETGQPGADVVQRGAPSLAQKYARLMVAIAGTAIHALLSKYRTKYHVSTKFVGNSTMLEDLFTFLTQGSRLAAVSARPIAVEALAVVGL
ncbi:hypothetical protein K438DRAFT_1983084 [Mycena galopus ATCC 62051]|nr:hypothetical protein K438DRAFT_1983084 [Mycena galopus ATCC 62051]